jgi:hypothetical protein
MLSSLGIILQKSLNSSRVTASPLRFQHRQRKRGFASALCSSNATSAFTFLPTFLVKLSRLSWVPQVASRSTQASSCIHILFCRPSTSTPTATSITGPKLQVSALNFNLQLPCSVNLVANSCTVWNPRPRRWFLERRLCTYNHNGSFLMAHTRKKLQLWSYFAGHAISTPIVRWHRLHV